MIELNTESPTARPGTPWSGLPHNRAEWSTLRQAGMWRYILRAKTTWGFFVLMGVINPLVLLLLFGAERGMWYAISGFMAGLLGGFWMSRIIWKKCEDAFAGNSDADAIAQ